MDTHGHISNVFLNLPLMIAMSTPTHRDGSIEKEKGKTHSNDQKSKLK